METTFGIIIRPVCRLNERRRSDRGRKEERNVGRPIALRKWHWQNRCCNGCGLGVADGTKFGPYKWEPFVILVGY